MMHARTIERLINFFHFGVSQQDEVQPNNESEKGSPIRERAVRTGRKLNNFIRMRFQIDCTAAKNDIDVDDLVSFKKNVFLSCPQNSRVYM